MILSLLKTYSRLLIFGFGLLLGIQVPNFVDQYSRRIDAHYQEVSENISGFQSTADLLFSGDLEELIRYYRQSNDAVFESDAQSIAISSIGTIVFAMRGMLCPVAHCPPRSMLCCTQTKSLSMKR